MPTSNGAPLTPNILNPPSISHLLSNGSTQQLLQTLPQMLNNPHPTGQPPLINPMVQPVSSLLSTPSNLLSNVTSSPSTNQQHRTQHSINQITGNHYPESKLHQQSLSRNEQSPNGTSATGMSRLPTTNGELTITTTAGPNSSQNLKRSPSSLSPGCNDNSTADLLVDSPSKFYFYYKVENISACCSVNLNTFKFKDSMNFLHILKF